LAITLLKDASEAGSSKEDLDAIFQRRDIYGVYARLLNAQPRELRDAAFQMLQIVAAAARPLTLEELMIVIGLKGSQQRFADVGTAFNIRLRTVKSLTNTSSASFMRRSI